MIQLSNASLVYVDQEREVYACRELSFDVVPGEFLGILGPSGSGKSSMLYLMSGLKVPTSGSVLYEGKSMSELSTRERDALRLKTFGFVFQQPYLIGYMTSLENVLLASPDEFDVDEGVRLLAQLGLEDKMKRLPHELSGGERQRVCVARALLGSPRVIFADEPTAFLDSETGSQVMDLLVDHRGEGTLIAVTHDPAMLDRADRVVRIVDGAIQGL
ncbi:MAG: ABC transporter ATP-binding protein [Armatimonadetes bacterium]|nr:ABC transporter ATP-binding protein [Armatimonadota bacterium]